MLLDKIKSFIFLHSFLYRMYLLSGLLLFLFIWNTLTAQTEFLYNKAEASADEQVTSFGKDIGSGLNAGYKIFTSPAEFDAKDWIYTGITLTSVGLTFLIDDDVRNSIKNEHSPLLDKFAVVGNKYGNIFYGAAFSGVIYLGGKLWGDRQFSKTGRMMLESLIYAGITSTIIKSILGRSRPYTEDGPSYYKAFQLKEATTSFPSGHTTVAFALSSVLTERLNNVYASIFLYSLASATVFERIYDDKHWVSDTLLGAVIGYTIGKAVVKFDDNSKSTGVSLSSYYIPNGAGLNLEYSF